MVNRIHITSSWSFCDDQGHKLDGQLFTLLKGIFNHGKLTAAAKEAQISYRHAWNTLNKWSAFFGTELVTLQKGRGASLSPLGEKLLWAEQRVAARLLPQMENLASELNIEIQRALQDASPLLRLHASHGYAVALLPQFAQQFQLDLQYKSPVEALTALNRGACDLAGFHLPVSSSHSKDLSQYQQYLKPRAHRLIRFITRDMGLMIHSDNPKQIVSIADLARKDIRFINRQKSSGSRTLLDQLLKQDNIDHHMIDGYNEEEFTHSAVAAYVAAGMADVGFGVEAAARQFGLEFIPLAQEDYLLVCHQQSLKQAALASFIATLKTEAFHSAVDALPGYNPSRCGDVFTIEQFFQPIK